MSDLADFFCLAPLYQGAPFFEGGYQVSAYQLSELASGRLKTWEILIPHALPEEATRYLRLPPVQLRERFQFHTMILALLGMAQTFGRVYQQLQSREAATNRFVRELMDREQAHIQSLIQELARNATALQTKLAAFTQGKDNQSVATVRQFLTTIEEAAQNGNLAGLASINSNEVSQALERMLSNH